MLTINIEGEELWDDQNEVFTYTEAAVLEFEHSLVSVSKWEAIHKKPFLTKANKTNEEMISYIECMLSTPDVSRDFLLERMSQEQFTSIADYINDPMTGSTIAEMPQTGARSSEHLSAELIYFWMNQYQIPYEARHWHLNQLFTLIKIHYAKSQKPRKMSKQKNAQSMAELNAARKARMGTKG